jgi:MFS family permease
VLGELSPVAPWAFGFPAVTIAILPGLMRPLVARPVIYSGLVIAATLGTGVAVQPLTRRLQRRGDLVGLAIGALGVFLGARAVAVGSPAWVFAAAVLLGGGYGLVMTTGLLEISERVPQESRGTAVGIYYVLTYIGFTLPFVEALAAKRIGDARTLALTGGAAVACLLIRGAIKYTRVR